MPIAIPLAIGAATIAGSAIAAGSTKSAAKTAAAAQTASDQQAIDLQREQFNTTRSDLSPWVGAGTSALGQQGNLLGLNGGEQQQSAIDALKASPMFASLFGTGQNAILANASATGGLRGGNTNASLANFGRDTLAGVINDQLTRLGSVSEAGQGAAAQTGAFGANSANAISSLLQNQGQAQAGSALATGAANASMIKDITAALGGMAGNTGVQSWVGKLF
jgi:hypothetical protein